jgi:class 3 adenylate cyclase/FixJ family two-component response regulator
MQTRKPQILYLDDEEGNLTSFVAAFRRHYNIFTTTSAAAALEILRNNEIDLIITDQRMPEMTGVQFLEKIIPLYPNSVRMILSGFSDIEAIIAAINSGAVLRYITKPWDENELKQIIDTGIKIHNLEENQRQLVSYMDMEIEQQNKAIELYKKYVPENVFLQVVGSQQEGTPCAGEQRVISALFVDICQFNKFSSTFEPRELVVFLNNYFAAMIDCVIKNNGYIYKLIGHRLLAIFGAPKIIECHQRNAMLCAFDMASALRMFNQQNNTEIAVSMGVNAGPAIVGHVMSDHFISYAVIGEAVDKAAKISGLAQQQAPNTILISQTAYDAVKNAIQAEVVSMEEGENLYKVIGKL